MPTEKPTTEDRALPSSETKQSSADPVQTEEDMDWEAGAQNSEEQHKEGLSEAKNAPSEGLNILFHFLLRIIVLLY